MLTLLNDRTYQVTVEKVENVKVGEQSRTIVTGWAVDKMRQTALPLAVAGTGMTVSRNTRVDLEKTYGLDPSDQAGFTIVIPQGVQNFDLMCQAPADHDKAHQCSAFDESIPHAIHQHPRAQAHVLCRAPRQSRGDEGFARRGKASCCW